MIKLFENNEGIGTCMKRIKKKRTIHEMQFRFIQRGGTTGAIIISKAISRQVNRH